MRIENIVTGSTPDDALRQRHEFVITIGNGTYFDAVKGVAIFFHDDDIVGHVDQLAGQVTGVRRLQRGIGQTLAGAVR